MLMKQKQRSKMLIRNCLLFTFTLQYVCISNIKGWQSAGLFYVIVLAAIYKSIKVRRLTNILFYPATTQKYTQISTPSFNVQTSKFYATCYVAQELFFAKHVLFSFLAVFPCKRFSGNTRLCGTQVQIALVILAIIDEFERGTRMTMKFSTSNRF